MTAVQLRRDARDDEAKVAADRHYPEPEPTARPAGNWRWRGHAVTIETDGNGSTGHRSTNAVCSCGWSADESLPWRQRWAEARNHLSETKAAWRRRWVAFPLDDR